MLNLEKVRNNIEKLAEEYNLCVNNNHFLFDGDLETLFLDSNIEVGETCLKAKDWEYGEDGWLIGCEDGDYLETVQLIQNGKVYLCQAFSNRCGDGLDYTLALNNVSAFTLFRNTNVIKETKINIDWYNALLDIPDLADFDDEHLELIKDECYGLYQFDFEDGSYITIDLCHGSSNYYDNCVWHSKDGKRDVTFDCSYCICSEMEFTVDNNTYICKLVVE